MATTDYKAKGLTKPVAGVPSSQEIRQQLAEAGRPVCVAFSGGKDAAAATLALIRDGIEVIPCHLYGVPGKEPGKPLAFVEDGLKAYEDFFQFEIHRYPHPSFYRKLNAFVFQPPERCEVIEAAQLPTPTFEQMWQMIRIDLGLPMDTWVADGVRAADSLVRRASIKNHGAMKPSSWKVSPIWDWLTGKTYKSLEDAGCPLPVDYEMFGRSFDGIDYRFLKPVKDRFPEDYQQILSWFPLAEMEIMRNEL